MSIFCKISLVVTLLLIGAHGQAQYFKKPQYPKNYFIWPVDARKGLAANFGELRPNHYHMGLDCRTDQVENKKVFASAAGYIARVKIEPWGFGQVIYINHPNGLTTLYAHLNKFNTVLDEYVTTQQYKQQSWAVDLDIPQGMFPVSQGDMIAYSGNTGGSMGPHVHFEVRDTKTDKVLNPLLMNFPITDNVPPQILRLAVYDRCLSTYEQTPKIYALKKVNGVYTTAAGKLNVNTERVSFAITAYDQYTGSTNQNGIYEAVLYDDNKPVSGFRLDSISYLETRYLNAHIDYSYRAKGGPYLQHLSRLPGYEPSIYKTDKSNGVISLLDGQTHAIKINVADPEGNTSELKFDIQMKSPSACRPSDADGLKKQFHPGFINIFENESVRFFLPENALYDSFTFKYNEIKNAAGKPIYQVHNATIPLQTYFTLNIKGNFPLKDTGKVIMHRSYGSKDDYVKATFNNGWYSARFREFGNYQLLVDDTPPVVTARGFHNGINASKLSRILFTITDDMEDLKNFTALLDGKWLRFSNDKGRNFIYNFDEKCPPGEHELIISVEDLAGNKTTKTYQFTR